jgi:HEPN domain-containing protein
MQLLDPDLMSLLQQWIEKAERDLDAARVLAEAAAHGHQSREIVGFLCQQAVEKYLKAFLTQRQIEFPKTHNIKELLALIRPADRVLADSLSDAHWLTPYGVEVRYPGDIPEMPPGDELKAIETASRVKEVMLAVLDAY